MKAIDEEKYTVEWMIQYYCKKNHKTKDMCLDCQALLTYCLERVDTCPFWPDKPACSKCSIHCYSDERRGEIRKVMVYSGPRIILFHPILAFKHLFHTYGGHRKL